MVGVGELRLIVQRAELACGVGAGTSRLVANGIGSGRGDGYSYVFVMGKS